MLKGFDSSAYPGSTTMEALKKYFDFCGFYLGAAPSHKDIGWMNALPTLRNLGYLTLPIFVGQQVVGPGAKKPSQANGVLDADRATQLMQRAGFLPDAPVYLDLENGAPMPPKEHDYAFAWIDRVRSNGFTPGVYCSHVLADQFDPKKTRIWAFKVPTTTCTYCDVTDIPAPQVDIPNAVARQYRQNIMLRPAGLLVDLDAAYDDTGLAR